MFIFAIEISPTPRINLPSHKSHLQAKSYQFSSQYPFKSLKRFSTITGAQWPQEEVNSEEGDKHQVRSEAMEEEEELDLEDVDEETMAGHPAKT